MEGEEQQGQQQEEKTYKVVANDEKQYSIWPADRENAEGWTDVGKTGTREECSTYANENWGKDPGESSS